MLLENFQLLARFFQTIWRHTGRWCAKKGVDFDQGLKYFLNSISKHTKNHKHQESEFLTGSERFFIDFDKMSCLSLFNDLCGCFFFQKNHKQSITSYAFDTNARRERDFRVENSQNDTCIYDFRRRRTNFIRFCCFFIDF